MRISTYREYLKVDGYLWFERTSLDWLTAVRLMKKKCVNLDTVHVNWVQNSMPDTGLQLVLGTEDEFVPRSKFFPVLMILSQLSLKRFTLVITSGEYQRRFPGRAWSLEQKHKWALHVKNAGPKKPKPSTQDNDAGEGQAFERSTALEPPFDSLNIL